MLILVRGEPHKFVSVTESSLDDLEDLKTAGLSLRTVQDAMAKWSAMADDIDDDALDILSDLEVMRALYVCVFLALRAEGQDISYREVRKIPWGQITFQQEAGDPLPTEAGVSAVAPASGRSSKLKRQSRSIN